MSEVLRARQHQKYLEVDVRSIDSSIAIMNHFDILQETGIIYESLLLKNALSVRIFGRKYSIALYVGKSQPNDYLASEEHLKVSTTFSDLRQLARELHEFSSTDTKNVPPRTVFYPVLRTIRYHSRQGSVETNRKLALKVPLLFCAQNKLNRIGYGDKWSWGVRIIEGTRYGETNTYYVTHLEVRSC
jgi:hypothetical protein